jgi:hypothetical protein
MSKLSSKQVAEWCETLYVNIPEVQLVNALRDAIRARDITGLQFDEILHSNTFFREFGDIWPDVSPVTAVLIRKLWHTDFYPQTRLDSWRAHRIKRLRPAQLQVDDMAEMVEHIVDVVTPSCSLNREQLFSRIDSILPSDVSAKIRESHSHC